MSFNYGTWQPSEFKPYKPEIETDELEDITEEFFTFLRNTPNLRDATFNILHLASKRWGKTICDMVYFYIIMSADKKRFLLCYQNENLTKILINAHIENFSDRIANINDIIEADYFVNEGYKVIIFSDEGVIDFNAKDALKTEMKEVGESFSDSSHKDAISVINAQDLMILKDLRGKSDIILIKRLNIEYIVESKHPFIRQYASIIENLDITETILISNHKEFRHIGILRFNVFDELSWLTKKLDEKISKNRAKNSFSKSYNKKKEAMIDIKKIAKNYIIEKGVDKCKKIKNHTQYIKYMLQNGDLREYQQYIKHIKDINTQVIGMIDDILCGKIDLNVSIEQNDVGKYLKKERKEHIQISDYKQFISEYSIFESDMQKEGVLAYLNGKSYRKIQECIEIGLTQMQNLIKPYIKHSLRRVLFAYLQYLSCLKVCEYPFETSYFIDESKKILSNQSVFTMYYHKDDRKKFLLWNIPTIFKNEVNFCKENNIETFIVCLIAPCFSNCIILKEISVKAIIIEVYKKLLPEPIKICGQNFIMIK